MVLIGMLDSPYVRRVAISMKLMGLAACEKAVQIHYELTQRPPDKRHAPWYERVVGQTLAAFEALEPAASAARPWLQGEHLNAADVMTAVAWRFGQFYDAEQIPAARFRALVEYSKRAEALPEFASTPLD